MMEQETPCYGYGESVKLEISSNDVILAHF
jgi:hypothetical protein